LLKITEVVVTCKLLSDIFWVMAKMYTELGYGK